MILPQPRRDRVTTNAEAIAVPATASAIPSQIAVPDPGIADDALDRSGSVDGPTTRGTMSPTGKAVAVAEGAAM